MLKRLPSFASRSSQCAKHRLPSSPAVLVRNSQSIGFVHRRLLNEARSYV
jgi:hypothetical protein